MRAEGLQSNKTGIVNNKQAVNTAITIPALLVLFFSITERSVLIVCVLSQGSVRKGNNTKNPAILSFCVLQK